MMRINLLPPEILERRSAEKRIGWVVIAGIGVAVILAGVGMFGFLRLQAKQDELAAVQQEVQMANAQAAQLAIFEERASELEARRATATLALSGRRNWARLYDELSLVLPADIWLQTMMTAEDTGLQITGYAIDPPKDSPDVGHKSMARLLVRLADLEQLGDVWLISSVKAEFEDQPALQFGVSATVSAPDSGSVAP